jgi:hypothetical protein
MIAQIKIVIGLFKNVITFDHVSNPNKFPAKA